jgi:hypothetical protein
MSPTGEPTTFQNAVRERIVGSMKRGAWAPSRAVNALLSTSDSGCGIGDCPATQAFVGAEGCGSLWFLGLGCAGSVLVCTHPFFSRRDSEFQSVLVDKCSTADTELYSSANLYFYAKVTALLT